MNLRAFLHNAHQVTAQLQPHIHTFYIRDRLICTQLKIYSSLLSCIQMLLGWFSLCSPLVLTSRDRKKSEAAVAVRRSPVKSCGGCLQAYMEAVTELQI